MDGFWCVLFVVSVIALFVGALRQTLKEEKQKKEEKKKEEERKKERVREAKEQYQEALINLQDSPASAEVKTETLRLGRVYAELAREMNDGDKSVTVFDEVALGNDISAATAGVPRTLAPQLPHEGEPATSDIAEEQLVETRLEKLASLKKKGLITDEEYSQRREKILDEL